MCIDVLFFKALVDFVGFKFLPTKIGMGLDVVFFSFGKNFFVGRNQLRQKLSYKRPFRS